MGSSRTESGKANPDLKYMMEAENLSGNVQVLADIINTGNGLSVAMSPSGKAYAVACTDGLINVYLTRSDRLLYLCNKSKSAKGQHCCSASSVRFRPWGRGEGSPNNLVLATFTNGKVKTFHFPTGECVHELKEQREVITSDYSSHGDTFATSGSDGVLNIYDDETRAKLISYEPAFNENAAFRRTYSIQYHPHSGDELITGGWDGSVRYYDLRVPHVIRKFHGPYVCGEGLSIDPAGREICSASWRRTDSLQLWDYGTGQLIKNVPIPRSRSRSEELMSGGMMRRAGMRKRSMSVVSLPRIPSSSLSSSRCASRTSYAAQNVENLNLNKLPHMLYCCRYFLNGDYIAFSGSYENSLAVVNKCSNEMVAAVSGLRSAVYSFGTFGPKIALASGEYVGLVKANIGYSGF